MRRNTCDSHRPAAKRMPNLKYGAARGARIVLSKVRHGRTPCRLALCMVALTSASTSQASATIQVGAPAHSASITMSKRASNPLPRASTGARF